jgi:hypothetical protein
MLLVALAPGCAGLGSAFGPDGGDEANDDGGDAGSAPLIPLRAGIVLTYDATIGYGDVTATGSLVESHVGMVDDDGQERFLVERDFTASAAGDEDPAGFGFVERRYFVLDEGAISLARAVVTYADGTVTTSTYQPPDLRFDRRAAIVLDHAWTTLGQVAIAIDDGVEPTEQTFDHRSHYRVAAAEERPFLDAARAGFDIVGTHTYGDSEVEVETFCATDLAIGYQSVVPTGAVGRPVTQDLVAVEGI